MIRGRETQKKQCVIKLGAGWLKLQAKLYHIQWNRLRKMKYLTWVKKKKEREKEGKKTHCVGQEIRVFEAAHGRKT